MWQSCTCHNDSCNSHLQRPCGSHVALTYDSGMWVAWLRKDSWATFTSDSCMFLHATFVWQSYTYTYHWYVHIWLACLHIWLTCHGRIWCACLHMWLSRDGHSLLLELCECTLSQVWLVAYDHLSKISRGAPDVITPVSLILKNAANTYSLHRIVGIEEQRKCSILDSSLLIGFMAAPAEWSFWLASGQHQLNGWDPISSEEQAVRICCWLADTNCSLHCS